MGNRRENVMSGIDKAMIPITIAIVICAVIPFMGLPFDYLAPEYQPKAFEEYRNSVDQKYFEKLEENLNEAEETVNEVRDLLAEHRANNP